MIALADSAKHTVQILDLLDERRMNYTFPFNKSELLLSAGFSLLWQCLELPDESKLVKDNQKSLTLLSSMLNRDSVIAGSEFEGIAGSFVTIARKSATPSTAKLIHIDSHAARLLDAMPAPEPKHRSPRKQLQAIASRFSSFNNKVKAEDAPRRATVPLIAASASASPYNRTHSTLSLPTTRTAPILQVTSPRKPRSIEMSPDMNLDYMPIGEEMENTSSTTMPAKPQMNDSAWEKLLTNIDSGHSSIYNGVYGSVSPGENPLHRHHTDPTVATGQDWAQEAWTVSDIDLATKGAVPRSVLSFSEESLTSGEDLVFSGCGSNNGSTAQEGAGSGEETFRGITIPNLGDDFDFDEFDARY